MDISVYKEKYSPPELVLTNLLNKRIIRLELFDSCIGGKYRYNGLVFPYLPDSFSDLNKAKEAVRLSDKFHTGDLQMHIANTLYDCIVEPLYVRGLYKDVNDATKASLTSRGDYYYRDMFIYSDYIVQKIDELGIKNLSIMDKFINSLHRGEPLY